ncbi:MAG TPA: acyltransferase, partial [Ilumatobacteraceae bacterium]|nr:acyltransferase [Ilumatobacteraceae bacterium]HRB05125.1 acyltransferase [Ilumatobacteraceae bacterium]
SAQSALTGWVRGGFIGVSVFFTLSGFLITSLLLRESSATGSIRLTRFWARRIRRLWPAAFAMLLAVIGLSAWGPLSARSSDTIAATWNVTNWHVIVSGESKLLQTIVGPLGPTWSLAVEEQFYVVLALLLVVVLRLRRSTTWLTIAASLGVVVPVVLSNVVTNWQPALEFSTVLRMPELFVGVLLAVWHRHGRVSLGAPLADVVAGGGLLALIGLFLLADYSPPWLLRGGYTLVAVTTALTIVGLLQHGRVAALLSWRPLRALGVVSYSLYLVHWPVMSVLTRDRTGMRGVTLLGVLLVASVAAAWVLHACVERPIRRLDTASLPTITAGFAGAALLTVFSVVAL